MSSDPLKPGDLAVVFRKVEPFTAGCVANALGAIVQVEHFAVGTFERLERLPGGGLSIEHYRVPAWLLREPHLCRHCGVHLFGFPAAVLRKLPDPDDVSKHDREQELAESLPRLPQPLQLEWE